MKLTDCALIQYARRLASLLETEKGPAVGVDEQDFSPKIYVLDGNKYCVLCLTKQIDEATVQATYTLGCIDNPLCGHVINVAQPPTDADLSYALDLIESKSLAIRIREPAQRSNGPRGKSLRQL